MQGDRAPGMGRLRGVRVVLGGSVRKKRTLQVESALALGILFAGGAFEGVVVAGGCTEVERDAAVDVGGGGGFGDLPVLSCEWSGGAAG